MRVIHHACKTYERQCQFTQSIPGSKFYSNIYPGDFTKWDSVVPNGMDLKLKVSTVQRKRKITSVMLNHLFLMLCETNCFQDF